MRRIYTHTYRGLTVETGRGIVDKNNWHIWINGDHDDGYVTKGSAIRAAHRFIDRIHLEIVTP